MKQSRFSHLELKHLEMLFDTSNEGLWDMHPDGSVKFFNKNFYKNFELNLEDSNIEEWTALIHPEDRAKFQMNVEEQTQKGIEDYISEYRVLNRRGDFVWIEAKGVAKFDAHGEFEYMVGSHSDISKRKNSEEKIFQLAYFDQLTGLYNRSMLLKRLMVSEHLQMLYFNLSKFRAINDTYGYERANEVLKIFARTLKAHFFDGDVFRVDADEFAVLLPDQMTKGELKVKIKFVKEDFKTSLYDIGSGIEIMMNIGHAMTSSDPLAILDNAKWAMIYGKKKALDYCIEFNEDIQKHTKRSLFMETGILPSLNKGEFYMTYQPIVDIRSEKTALLEALMRWDNPEYGMIMPDEFIAVSEKTRAIINLGQFALIQACEFILEMDASDLEAVPISINISAIQLFEVDFYHFVLETLSKYQVAGNRIIFEITESVALDMTTRTIDVIRRFKALGIKIALDDYGSGFSSLTSLLTIPFDYIKIDKGIIQKMVSDTEIRVFIGALMYLCHSKGLMVISEGIETYQMRNQVTELQTDFLQGYFYAKPLKKEQVLPFISK